MPSAVRPQSVSGIPLYVRGACSSKGYALGRVGNRHNRDSVRQRAGTNSVDGGGQVRIIDQRFHIRSGPMADQPSNVATMADPIGRLSAPIAYRLANAPMRSWPFDHMEIDGLLPDAAFQAVRATKVTDSLVSRPSSRPVPSRQYNPARFHITLLEPNGDVVATLPPAFRDMVALLAHPVVVDALMSRFRTVIAQRFGGRLPAPLAQAEYLDDRSGYELRPHTDVPQKLVTVLLYFADDDADPELGTALYHTPPGMCWPYDAPAARHYSADQLVEVYRVPYRPNRALVFAPCANSLHGVPRVSDPTHPRRLVQYQLNTRVRVATDSPAV